MDIAYLLSQWCHMTSYHKTQWLKIMLICSFLFEKEGFFIITDNKYINYDFS